MKHEPLDLHPLCKLFPAMDPENFALFKASIQEHGQQEPITTLDGMVLDGQNRQRAVIELGRRPKYEEFKGGVTPKAFVLAKNLDRRHIPPAQRAAIVALATNYEETAAVGRPAGNAAAVPDLSTVATRAAEAGVGERTQRSVDKVARSEGGKDLLQEVAAGKAKLAEVVAKVRAADAGAAATPAPAPAPGPAVTTEKRLSKVERLEARIADLEEKNAELLEERNNALEEVAIANETIQNLQAVAAGEAADRLLQLQESVRVVTAERDTLQRTDEVKRKEILRLQRQVKAKEKQGA